jgi:hypothetical protein
MSLFVISFPYTPWIRCPHCQYQFELYPGSSGRPPKRIVQPGAIINCPACRKNFPLPVLEYLTAGAKPWPWWVFLVMVLAIMGAGYGFLCLAFTPR